MSLRDSILLDVSSVLSSKTCKKGRLAVKKYYHKKFLWSKGVLKWHQGKFCNTVSSFWFPDTTIKRNAGKSHSGLSSSQFLYWSQKNHCSAELCSITIKFRKYWPLKSSDKMSQVLENPKSSDPHPPKITTFWKKRHQT